MYPKKNLLLVRVRLEFSYIYKPHNIPVCTSLRKTMLTKLAAIMIDYWICSSFDGGYNLLKVKTLYIIKKIKLNNLLFTS